MSDKRSASRGSESDSGYTSAQRPRDASQAQDEHISAVLKEEKGRLQTFHNWPLKRIISPAELARAGFFYCGTDDWVCCPFCQLRLNGWTRNNCAYDMHARRCGNCSFIRNTPLPQHVQHEKMQKINGVYSCP